jgi:hypothetical protein
VPGVTCLILAVIVGRYLRTSRKTNLIFNHVISLIRFFFFQSGRSSRISGDFFHLYFDIAWFGILSGTAINFLSAYLPRDSV